jgi:hypothetical protein
MNTAYAAADPTCFLALALLVVVIAGALAVVLEAIFPEGQYRVKGREDPADRIRRIGEETRQSMWDAATEFRRQVGRQTNTKR